MGATFPYAIALPWPGGLAVPDYKVALGRARLNEHQMIRTANDLIQSILARASGTAQVKVKNINDLIAAVRRNEGAPADLVGSLSDV